MRSIAILAWAALGPLLAADNLTYEKLVPEKVMGRLREMPTEEKQRPAAFQRMLTEAGCPPEEFPSRDRKRPPDFEAQLGSPGAPPILVVAHIHTQGVVDNWSGLAMLANLCQSFLATRFRHALVLAAPGQQQFRENVRKWATASPAPVAAIDLAALGAGPLSVWRQDSSEDLVARVRRLVKESGIELPGVALEGRYPRHGLYYDGARIPRILFHSLTPRAAETLNRGFDQLRNIHADAYYSAYLILAAYIVLLDFELP